MSYGSFDCVKPTCRRTFSRALEYSYRNAISGAPRGFDLQLDRRIGVPLAVSRNVAQGAVDFLQYIFFL